MNMPKIYVIDDILHGLSNFNKLRDIYLELKEELLTTPIQTSDRPLVTLNTLNTIKGNYGWEFYSIEDALVMLEYYGSWKGYVRESQFPKIEDSYLRSLRVTIHNTNPKIEKIIDTILMQYPCD